VIPSYLAKLARAEKHLIELETAVDAFVATDPYTVRERIEGKKKRRRLRLEFTSFPVDTDIPVIAADVINNLRFSLDHLMCAMVPPKERRRVMFPIFFEGVWDAIVPGEKQERVKERTRWASVVKTLSADAIAVLKDAQPPDGAGKAAVTDTLRLINRWSNHDRHRRLPIIAANLEEVKGRITYADGTVLDHRLDSTDPEGTGFKDGTEIPVPEGAVKMQIHGIPLVAIDVGTEDRYIGLPDGLSEIAAIFRDELIPSLQPFVRADAAWRHLALAAVARRAYTEIDHM
jgi:hypothetical protein